MRNDHVELPAHRLAALVRSRRLTPREALEPFARRIAALDAALGAFVHLRLDAARAEAAALETNPDLASLPLAGVPVAVKDNIDVAGEPTRLGSAATSDAPAAEDDPLVTRLRAAGALIVGKTKMPELAIWGTTEPRAFGPARNPWDLARTTGGSSGGSAAAVAARMVPLALGSDGGGSLRIPAGCCGIVAIKPGPGVVRPAAKLRGHWFGMTQFGPFANCVKDAALALDVLSGREAYAEVAPPGGKLRIAVSLHPPDPTARLHPDVREAVLETALLLRELGHEVVAAEPPYPPAVNLRWSLRAYSGVAQEARALDWSRLEPQTRGIARFGRTVTRLGLATPPSGLGSSRRLRDWLAGFDLALLPVLSSPAVPLDSWNEAGWLLKALRMSRWVWTLPSSLAQVPAAAVPARLSREGLPVAVQLQAAPGRERILLEVAAQLEAVRPWRRPPELS